MITFMPLSDPHCIMRFSNQTIVQVFRALEMRGMFIPLNKVIKQFVPHPVVHNIMKGNVN